MPETVAVLRPPARMAYLKVTPAAAATRLHRSVHLRPLIREDPERALSRLLGEREAAYSCADLILDTESLTRQDVIDALRRLALDPG